MFGVGKMSMCYIKYANLKGHCQSDYLKYVLHIILILDSIYFNKQLSW